MARKLGEFTVISVWRGKVWRIDRFNHKVIIISKILDGFSLTNHGQFAKFTKLFPRQTFPLYGNYNEIFKKAELPPLDKKLSHVNSKG